jgi:uncharacterized HhH-GPD family protein
VAGVRRYDSLMPTGTLCVTGRSDADRLLNTDGTALLIGMLLDQQIPMERAFTAPITLLERLGHLDPVRIAAMDVDDLVAVCAEKPAVHRFPASMGKRLHELCVVLAAEYDGRGDRVWRGVRSAEELLARLRALPGFGADKSQIFVALLGKRMGVTPSGWREAAGRFGDDEPRSVADIDSPDALVAVRARKQLEKQAAASGSGRRTDRA